MIKLLSGGPGGGGSVIPEWGTGPFLVEGAPGVPGARFPATVDGEPCIARWDGSQYELMPPSSAAQAYAAANVMPPGAWTAPSRPQPWFFSMTGIEHAVGQLNNGSLWFNDTAAARNFRWQARNISGRASDKVRVVLGNSFASATSAVVAVGIGGSGYSPATWTTPVTVPIPAAGPLGPYNMALAYVDIDLPSNVAANGRLVISIDAPAALAWSGYSSAGASADPDSYIAGPEMGALGVTANGGWTGSGYGLGMQLVGLQWHNPGSANVVRLGYMSDSRGSAVPGQNVNLLIRQGIPLAVNSIEATKGPRYSVASCANGTYNFDNYATQRLGWWIEHQPAVLQALFNRIDVDLASWNAFPSSSAAATAQIASYEGLRDQLLALDISSKPMTITPPGAAHQATGKLDAWGVLAAYVAANGVHIAPAFADPGTPTLINPAESGDLVHINTASYAAAASEMEPLYEASLSGEGYF